MRAFANMITQLGTSTKTNEKLRLLSEYFATAPDSDKIWVIALFSGRRPRRITSSALLRQWCNEITGIPDWLFDECYHTVGDLGETIALLLPPPKESSDHISLTEILSQLLDLGGKDDNDKRVYVVGNWMRMNKDERFVFNKLLTGNFRIGVSQKMVVNAIGKSISLEPSVIAHRISGNWDPATTKFDALLSESETGADISKSYPFYLAYALEVPPEELGEPGEWQAEWKWDGIRGQLVKREGQLFTWSRGEELITEKFPEYDTLAALLPDGLVLDGEIIPSRDQKPLPFSLLQTRIGRKNVTKQHLRDVPISFFAYDILELEGKDIRETPLEKRREWLEDIVARFPHPALILSPVIRYHSWKELSDMRDLSRDIGAEGMMLKRKNSAYQVGRKRGDWWKWKVDPLTIDAVMIYAQKGSGRRSGLYTDYTFAVKDGDKLVSFAKAYSGLTDKEFAQVDRFVKNNSIEKFGPVRTVKPELVFEIAFEGIAASNRHKSGVALRFPRINRWRRDKKPEEINTLEDLKKMLETYGQ